MGDVRAAGLVLAAGAGTRFGGPKGLARTAPGEPWVARAVGVLKAGGCAPVFVAVGARGAEVEALVSDGAEAVHVDDWQLGLSASLRAGLRAAAAADAAALVIVTVDTPGMPAEAVRRILAHAAPGALVQGVYAGRPGHPVLIGRDHFDAVAGAVTGDRGAGAYLRSHGAVAVECGDLWSGEDVDRR